YCPYITNGKQSTAITIVWSSVNATRGDLTARAAQQWSDILNLNVQPQEAAGDEFASNLQSAGGPYQAWIVGWLADYPDPQDWLTLQFHTGYTSTNLEGVSDTNLDTLMDQADLQQDPAKRAQMYNQAERTVVADIVPWIPLDQQKQSWLQRPWVT